MHMPAIPSRRLYAAIGVLGAISLLTAAVSAAGGESSWTMMNPTGREYKDELVRLKMDAPKDITTGRYVVKEDGKEISWQIEEIGGKKYIWVVTDLGKGQIHTYEVVQGRAARSKKKVKVKSRRSFWTLDNGLLSVKVPAKAVGLVGPVGQVRLPNGKWVGKGSWRTDRKLKQFTSELIGDGTVFAKIRLRYEFEGRGGLFDETPSFYQADVSLAPGKRHAVIEESYAMGRGDYWEFDCASGWQAGNALVKPHFGGFGRPTMKDPQGEPYPFPPKSLNVGQTRMGDTLLNLIPRWSQAYDDGWFFMVADGSSGVGALACRAGKWFWPYNNMIEIKVKESADYAGLRCPTWRGKRYWYLVVGPKEIWETDKAKAEYVMRYAVEGLDKLHHEFVLDWPGLEPPKDKKLTPEEIANWSSGAGRFSRRSKPFPGWGPGGAHWSGSDNPITALTALQSRFDPDSYGNHWLYYSPENPNFFTHWVNQMFSGIETLKTHPRFKAICKLAEMKFREELYHSVTLPGGAGQECFGYMSRGSWQHRAKVCRAELGFDPAKWPWQKAAGSYIFRTSQPMPGGSRSSHPGGDTHPPGPNPFDAAQWVGADTNVAALKTEEFPGFGITFRNNPGTPKETYFAFKSGPNRGHFHGDQLSFHYCAYGRPLAVDHHSSYAPRPGQEHMHNRVAFHTDTMPWANMDGYERLIAFKTSGAVDAAIGQVESERLRERTKFPPERWDWSLPQEALDPNLKYRRTVVQIRNDQAAGQDIFVLRDQHIGPELYATYSLHVLGERCERKGNTFDFDGLKVFFVKPAEFDVSRHDWQHEYGGKEATKGLRVTVKGTQSEFITVLIPRPVKRCDLAKIVFKGAFPGKAGKKGSKSEEAPGPDLHVNIVWEAGKQGARQVQINGAKLGREFFTFVGTVKTGADESELRLKAEGVTGRWHKNRVKMDYAVRIKRDGDKLSGTYSGNFLDVAAVKALEKGEEASGVQKSGDVAGAVEKNVIPSMPVFDETWKHPAVEACPGGVRIGGTEVVFSGGIDDDDRTAYVTVKHEGKTLLSVTGKDVDMNRSQGEIGLFVPDAGYPFGVMPDWLLRQRCKKPDWYEETWPLVRQ